MMQTIPHGIWTKLDGHELEVWHNSGCPINVEAVDGRLATSAPGHAEVELRSVGGVYPPGWCAPVAGWYRFGYRDDRYETATRIELPLDAVVLADVRRIDTGTGPVYAFPEIGMNTGEPLLTCNAEHGLEVDWSSDRG